MDEKDKWPAIKSIVMIASERRLEGEEPTFETRFFISSLPADATTLAEAVRTHWRIENNLHWTLDVAFREDECRVQKEYGTENFDTLRHISLNLL